MNKQLQTTRHCSITPHYHRSSPSCITLPYPFSPRSRLSSHQISCQNGVSCNYLKIAFKTLHPSANIFWRLSSKVLSDGTIHGVIWRTGVGRKGLGFNLCVAPPHRIVPDFGVTEFTEVFQSRPEKMEKTRGSRRWVHYGQYTNWSYHT